MPSVPKFGRKVPHPRCDSHTSFKVKVQCHQAGYFSVTRDISRPPLGGGVHPPPDFQSTPLQFKKKKYPLGGCNKLLSNCLLQTWHPCSKM